MASVLPCHRDGHFKLTDDERMAWKQRLETDRVQERSDMNLLMAIMIGGLGLFLLFSAWIEWDDKEERGGAILLLIMGLFLSWLGVGHLLAAF